MSENLIDIDCQVVTFGEQMTQALRGEGSARPVAPVASDLERLEYISDLSGVLRQISVDGGFHRLAFLLELATLESERLRQAQWTGQGSFTGSPRGFKSP